MFTHNGIEVTRQVISSYFADTLRKNGVEYLELPLVEHRVYSYRRDGEKSYALVHPLCVPEEYQEAVYITPEVPFDGWAALMEDVEAQQRGESPRAVPSRLKLLIGVAEKRAFETLEERYPADDVFSAAQIPEAELMAEIRHQLEYMGYGGREIREADSHDVDPAALNRLLKA